MAFLRCRPLGPIRVLVASVLFFSVSGEYQSTNEQQLLCDPIQRQANRQRQHLATIKHRPHLPIGSRSAAMPMWYTVDASRGGCGLSESAHWQLSDVPFLAMLQTLRLDHFALQLPIARRLEGHRAPWFAPGWHLRLLQSELHASSDGHMQRHNPKMRVLLNSQNLISRHAVDVPEISLTATLSTFISTYAILPVTALRSMFDLFSAAQRRCIRIPTLRK